jgi:hypothetical protein
VFREASARRFSGSIQSLKRNQRCEDRQHRVSSHGQERRGS